MGRSGRPFFEKCALRPGFEGFRTQKVQKTRGKSTILEGLREIGGRLKEIGGRLATGCPPEFGESRPPGEPPKRSKIID